MATNTNPQPADDASRVSTVMSTRIAQKPEVRSRARRHSDDAIVTATLDVLRQHPTMGWVEALRSIRWSAQIGCDYKRFKPLFVVAQERLAAEQKPARKPRQRRKSA